MQIVKIIILKTKIVKYFLRNILRETRLKFLKRKQNM